MKLYNGGVFFLLGGVFFASSASAYETVARNALLMDFDTGEYLYSKNETEAVPPASMSKLMTVYILISLLLCCGRFMMVFFSLHISFS